MMHGKIHRATVTEANLEYMGSITIDEDIIVGAASFVRKSISDKGIYSGNPAILKIKSK